MTFNHIPLPIISLKCTTTIKGRWYITPSGDKYMSVTTMLGKQEKPQLISWKEAFGKEKAEAHIKRAANRGTLVHKMIELYLQNDPNYKDVSNEDVVNKCFNNIRRVLNKINNILAQEIPLYSDKLRLAGSVDCIAEYKGILSIIDFKTSINVKSSTTIEDYFLQCTAYAIMVNERYNIAIEQIVVIIAAEKGLPTVFVRNINNFIKPLLIRNIQFNKE